MVLHSDLDYDILSTAFNSIDTGILIHDEKNKILVFNHAMSKITGHANSEAIGKDCRTIFKPTFCDPSCALCDKPETMSKNAYHEIKAINKDGDERWLRVSSVKFMREGNRYYLVTVTDISELKQNEDMVFRSESFDGVVGKSEAIRTVFEFVRSVSETDMAILIIGETGTGKELIASAIQKHSLRRNGPYIKVNCSALPEQLIESELFGHVKGAYTGATNDRIGRFEAASKGTIFLDEIGDVSLQFQAKLLRVLQEKEIERVGENTPRKIDVRILSATNKDLREEVKRGRFREDLYYRLAMAPINLPSLRERKEDIPLLALNFTKHFSLKYGRNLTAISPEMMTSLIRYDWPGNVRELYNFIEVAMATCKGNMLNLDKTTSSYFMENSGANNPPGDNALKRTHKTASDVPEKNQVAEALKINRYNVSSAAKALGISRTTLWRKMRAFGINRAE